MILNCELICILAAAAAQPVNVKIFPLNSTTVNVTWQQPGASDIKTYVVNYQVVGKLMFCFEQLKNQ